MPKLIHWILEQCKALMIFLLERSKTKTSWSFADGVRFVSRERREPREGEVEGFKQRMRDQGTGTLLVPAIQYSSSEEFRDLAKAGIEGTSALFNAVALSIERVDKNFLRFINRRAKEGQTLYFDIYLSEQKASKAGLQAEPR